MCLQNIPGVIGATTLGSLGGGTLNTALVILQQKQEKYE
jgi:hypothetical protein